MKFFILATLLKFCSQIGDKMNKLHVILQTLRHELKPNNLSVFLHDLIPLELLEASFCFAVLKCIYDTFLQSVSTTTLN